MVYMILSQKIRIYPNKTMCKQFEEFFGYARYSYNAGIALWEEMYEAGEKPNERKVRDKYKRSLKQDWEASYPPNIFDNSITHLAGGYKMFFNRMGNKPKFKSKRKAKKSFTINRKGPSTIRIKNDKLFLPKFKYGVKMAENIRFEGCIKLATVTKRANQYYVSLSIELGDESYLYRSGDYLPTVGVDANIGHFDVSEETHRWETPLNKLAPLYEKISHYQRLLSKKKLDSKKYNVMKTKLQNTYLRIQNIQDDWLHKFTSYLVHSYHKICIEDLNIKGMLSNKRISKKIARSLFYRFRVQLQYKCEMYGNELIIADRWFPSTQHCSICGFRKEGEDKLKLSDRIYHCNNCGETLDRDYNSACNLKIYAERVG